MSQTKIVIVEDESMVAMQIKHNLEELGYTVPGLAATGAAALQVVSETRPDLVLMDIRLKGDMDGIETARQIRARFKIPVVYLTAFSDETTVKRASSTQPLGFILKPFTKNHLRISLELALSKKQAEQTAPDELYQALIEDTPALVCCLKPDGTLTFVNTAYCIYFNKNKSELIGENFFQFIPLQSREFVKQQFQTLTPEAPTSGYEHPITAPGDVVRWQSWINRAVFDDQRRLVEYQSIGYDITERKRVEQELLLSDQILQQMPDAIVLTNLEGIIQRWMGKAEDIFGYTATEAVGQPITFIFHPANTTLTGQIMSQIRATGTYVGENLYITKAGHAIPIETTAKTVFTKSGAPLALIGLLKDISARKQAENALQESEERFRLAFENANIGVCLIDFDGRLLRVNLRMSQILGYSRQELEGLNIFDITPPADHNTPAEFIQNSLAGNTDQIIFEKRYIHKQGHTICCRISSSLVRDSQGQPIYFISHVQDISEQKRAEAEREQLIKKMEAQNVELERFTYAVSHDLKSPLITIRGFLGFLERDALNGNTNRLKENLGHIRLAADKMRQLLNDLLELSRAGQLTAPPQAIPLNQLVAEALALLAGPINLRGVQVQVAPALPTITGDRPRLLQVFQNLIENAIKFMGHQPNPIIKIGGRNHGDYALCYIQDNGIGIDPLYHQRIFNVFDRLTTETEGTGIGLSLVKRIVEVHHGQVWVESAGAGLGCTFWLKLPLANAD